MTMKKILKEWQTYLKENDSTLTDTEVRLKLSEKMASILFGPIRSRGYDFTRNDMTFTFRTHFCTSTFAVPFVIAPSLSITFGLAAAGISSIAFNEPFGC